MFGSLMLDVDYSVGMLLPCVGAEGPLVVVVITLVGAALARRWP